MPCQFTMSDSREGDLNLIQLQKVTEFVIKLAQVFVNIKRGRLSMSNSLLYITNNN